MDEIFQKQLWNEVQDRLEAGILINFGLQNIKPTGDMVENELDKAMMKLVDKLCKLYFQEVK